MIDGIPYPMGHEVDLEGEANARARDEAETVLGNMHYQSMARQALEAFDDINAVLERYGIDEIDDIHQLREWCGVE